MPWVLAVLGGGSGNVLRTITEKTSPNPVMSIEAVVDGVGRTSSITVRARPGPDTFYLPRHLLQYTAWKDWQVTFNGKQVTFQGDPVKVQDNYGPLAVGTMVTFPPLDNPGAGPADRDADALERITAVGLEHLLRERVLPPQRFTGEMDVAEVAYEVCTVAGLSPIIVDAKNFHPTGHTLGGYYAPEKPVFDALDELAALVPGSATWWVRADRSLMFAPHGGL